MLKVSTDKIFQKAEPVVVGLRIKLGQKII